MRNFFRLGLLLIVIFFIGTFSFWQWSIQPVNSKVKAVTVFVIPQGQSAKTIGKRLKQQNYIRSRIAFELMVDKKDYGNKLQAGDFRLSQSMNLSDIIETFTHASLDFWITFPEGLRVEEYAEKLATKTDINTEEFILAAKTHEGMLFPDTYLIPQTASVQNIIDLLVGTFNQKSPTKLKKDIILASLIEREARRDQDRSLVSSVLHNRIKLGMALQIDATVQYALGNSKVWWKKDLTLKDLKINSPYNTYAHNDLPPAPIANPGLASLEAAINPATTNYLYYVSDSNGYNHYAEDLDGHQANIKQYLD